MKQFKQMLITWMLLLISLHPQTAEWQQTNGPLGGDVSAVTMNNAGTLIAGTRLGGLYRSTDGGYSWEHIPEFPQAPFLFNGVWDLTRNSQGHLFAATSYGVYRSIDNGDSWTAFDAGLTNRFVETLGINSIDVIFAGTRGGIFRSEDNGENWTAFNNGLTELHVSTMTVTPLGDVLVGTTNGVFISSDNGDNWAEISSGLDNKNVLSVYSVSEDTLLTSTYSGAYISYDHGSTWNKLDAVFGIVLSFARQSDSLLFAGSGGFFFRSFDNGLTWSQTLTEKLEFGNFTDIFITPSSELIASTWNHGIVQSSNSGTTWRHTNTGLTIADVITLKVTPSGSIFAGTNEGIYRTTDGGDTWEWLLDPNIGTDFRALASNSAGRLFVSSSGNFALSDDNGNTWTLADSSLSERWAESIAFGTDDDVYVGFYGKIFKSTNGGATWSELPDSLPQTSIQALAVASDGTVFAGTRNNGVLRSTDAGNTWEAVNNGIGENFDMTAFLFQQNGDVLVSGFDGLFRSSDYGDTWEKEGDVPILGVKDLVRDSEGNLFISMRGGGVAVSEDDGTTWTNINSGLWHKDAKALLTDNLDNIYVGTRGGGVFKIQFIPTAVELSKDVFLNTFVLEQNYPNPFNPSTTIKYTIPSDVKRKTLNVKLDVYDILGREVATLINDKQKPGYYEVEFDGKDLTSDIYFYRLRAGGFVETKKMLLMK
jgi:photosystem II stability/assembly factor-like uncharacterized protein